MILYIKISHLQQLLTRFQKEWSFGAENFFCLQRAGGALRALKKKIAKNDNFLKSGQKLLKYDLIYKNIPSTAIFDQISKKWSFGAEKIFLLAAGKRGATRPQKTKSLKTIIF